MNKENSLYPFSDVSVLIRQKRFKLATKRGYFALLRNMVLMALLILFSFSQIFLITAAHGTDMFPAVLDGDLMLCYRLEKDYLKNDIVVCTVEGKQVTGRVAARAGDSVNITEDGSLYVNGTQQQGEIAFPTYPGKQQYPYTVPDGFIYILGDFRTQTTDSREFGPVELKNVKGKVISILRKRGL